MRIQKANTVGLLTFFDTTYSNAEAHLRFSFFNFEQGKVRELQFVLSVAFVVLRRQVWCDLISSLVLFLEQLSKSFVKLCKLWVLLDLRSLWTLIEELRLTDSAWGELRQWYLRIQAASKVAFQVYL